MALTKYTQDTSIIGQLGTRPEDRPGMTDQQLKDKFDENALTWKEFWNNTASEEIDALIAAIKGEGWTSESLKGLADIITAIKGTGWTNETLKGLADLLSNLAGTGRTTETVKGNADTITTHKSSLGDHNGFVGTPKGFPSFTDFNDLTSLGVYHGVLSTAMTNEPYTGSTPRRVTVIVRGFSDLIVIIQEIFYEDGVRPGKLYRRIKIASVWKNWIEIKTTTDDMGTAIPATTGTISVTMDGEIKSITPTGACTFNALGGVKGQTCSFVITTSGTTSYTLTWGTAFKSIGTLATGTVSGKVFTVSFIFDGTNWVETGRTTAM